jgi:Protein of unknown function (DUF3631)
MTEDSGLKATHTEDEGGSQQSNQGRDGGMFERAAAFGDAMAEDGKSKAKDIYLWEHGVAVEPWPEPVDGKELLDAIVLKLKQFVFLPKWAATILALWVIHTFAFHLRGVATYLGIESPVKRCGKSTLLMVLCELVNRPVVASNISSSAFYRVIEEKCPTLLIDEADTVLRRNKELQGILNAGYAKRTAYVIRVTAQRPQRKNHHVESGAEEAAAAAGKMQESEPPGHGMMLGRFSSWCPKAIATIKHLPETLADRCIVISMKRKTRQERCQRLKNLDGTELRRKCARYVLDHAEEIRRAEPGIPEDLNDRAADICEPLLVMADLAGGDWPATAREAALGLTTIAQEENPTTSLLLDLKIVLLNERFAEANGWMKAEGGARIFSRDLVAALNAKPDRPWLSLRRGQGMTETWLSQQLRPYGIRPKTIWIGATSAKGYLEVEMEETFRRYIPKSALQTFIEEAKAQHRSEAVGNGQGSVEAQNS